MDLFDHYRATQLEAEAPLAARMRPRTLEEFIGQDGVVGPGRLLRRAIQADQLSSIIFYGPPGTGKTTLARIIANTTRGQFLALNAVLAGVKDIRAAIASAQELRGQYGRRTILFVDEVHRFNKAQQDALLPWVENGTVILVGATTENPFFEVNKALVSRSRLFQLHPLGPEDLRRVVQQALGDPVRGYGDRPVVLASEALDHLVNVANGDARALLNALELAVETTPPGDGGTIAISLTVAEESIQQRAVLYDKEGDAHFDIISAFIKSVRGSDPDAALYWLARMVYAGEDPRYIFRRLIILASEDVGLADPQAVTVVTSCAAAYDRIGLPEGRYPLAQATLYLATAPKSNSTMAFFDALATVEKEQEAAVPNPLRDPSRDNHGFGHGQGYLYPHAYRDHWVAQQYLPTALQGRVFYQPTAQGYEGALQTQVAQRREAQLAAMVEDRDGGGIPLTTGWVDAASDRWLQRTVGQTGARLAALRDRLFTTLAPQRHHVLLDLHSPGGFLTWEALRRVPEGGVYSRAPSLQGAATLTEQAAALPALLQPQIFHCPWPTLGETLATVAPGVKFDGILGRNALGAVEQRTQVWPVLAQVLAPQGRLVLVETIPRHTPLLAELIPPTALADQERERWHQAETHLYHDPRDPRFNWTGANMVAELEAAGFQVTAQEETQPGELWISAALGQRWFDFDNPHSYGSRLVPALGQESVEAIAALVQRHLWDRTVPWPTTQIFLTATLGLSQVSPTGVAPQQGKESIEVKATGV